MVYMCGHVVWGKSKKEKERNWGARLWWGKFGEVKKQKGEEKK